MSVSAKMYLLQYCSRLHSFSNRNRRQLLLSQVGILIFWRTDQFQFLSLFLIQDDVVMIREDRVVENRLRSMSLLVVRVTQ